MEKDIEVVELFIQKHKGKSVVVFTDGSVYSGQLSRVWGMCGRSDTSVK